MDLYAIDLETFYDAGYSLSKMTTEEYVNDQRFEVIGLAIKKNGGPTEWYSGDDVAGFLSKFDLANGAILCHNTMFDGAILQWRYGVNPKKWIDTMSMARYMHGVHESASLASMAQRYGVGEKGDEVVHAMGKRRVDFSKVELAKYGEYCINDVDLTYDIFSAMLAAGFPLKELRVIDLTLRMYIQPTLHIDCGVLIARKQEVVEEKNRLLSSLMGEFQVESTEEVRAVLASNKKFAELLESRGVNVPMKVSPTTGKETYALAKKDPGFIELTESEDDFIPLVCSVRLDTKSTIEEGRIDRFLGVASRNDFKLPVPLNYCGAHTGRWSGKDSINLQNLPSRNPKKKALKNSITAPPGHVIIDCDSSQIEARILAWLAGQEDVIEAFANKQDVYRLMGSAIYDKAPEDITPEERFLSKTVVLGCLAEGTLVLCENGWKPIEQVTTEDQVWDGIEWVNHQGLLKKGSKETLNLCGLWLTPDHKVLCGTEWKDAQSVHQDASTLYQTLVTGAESLSSLAMWQGSTGGYEPSSSNATAVDLNTRSTITTSRTSEVHGAIRARLQSLTRRTGKVIGFTPTQWPTTGTESGFSTDYPPRLLAATLPGVSLINPMGAEEYTFATSGAKTDGLFYGMYKRSMGGIDRITKWIGQTTTGATSPETSGSYRATPTSKTVEKYLSYSQKSKSLRKNLQTYDLAFSGPRNRFTVLTDAGPVIVHNCGYGTGWKKLQFELNASGVKLPDDECKQTINVYRRKNDRIVELWYEAEAAIKRMISGGKYSFGIRDCFMYDHDGVYLPNGYKIRYPGLHFQRKGEEIQYFYKGRKGLTPIWYGTVVENAVQGLARCVISDQMLRIAKRYRPVLTVHDAIAVVVPEEEKDEAVAFVEESMHHVPRWAEGCPISCESGVGFSYGEC